MPATAVVGKQRGDEGKAKAIDELVESEGAIHVVRFQGGNNAGHTLKLPDGSDLILHLLSSAVRHEDCYIGQTSGVVNDLMQMNCEIKEVNHALDKDITKQLKLDQRVMVLLPYHRFADFAIEHHLQKIHGAMIGSTGRGIKPAYIDEVEGREIRLFDLADKDTFARKVKENAEFWVRKIVMLYGVSKGQFEEFGHRIDAAEKRAKQDTFKLVEKDVLAPSDFDYLQFMAKDLFEFDADRIIDVYQSIYEGVKHRVCDLSRTLNEALNNDEHVVFEGAQGAVLDKTWAYGSNRTHSNTITGAICTSAGISPMHISRIIGVAKSYGTGVGTHVLPTEIDDPYLRSKLMEHEFGATTGRQRMVYWWNMPEERVAQMITGATEGVINKLDLLSGAKKLKIAIGLRHSNAEKLYDFAPPDLGIIRQCTPIYEEVDGWEEDISQCRDFNDLPEAAQRYVLRYEEEMQEVTPGFRVTRIGVSPTRDGVIVR